MYRILLAPSLPILVGCAVLQAQQSATALEPTTAAHGPTQDTSYIDAQGTAHVTRVRTISAEAQRR
jgi:hypothetical protein